MEIASQPDRSADEEPTRSTASNTSESDRTEEEMADPSEEMAKADVANGERPEQPVSQEQRTYERQRTDHEPKGEQRQEQGDHAAPT
jgi:hypothetical protein